MLTTHSDSILREIVTQYRSLDEPDFAFQSSVIATRPFAPLIDELLVHFFVKDTTRGYQDAGFTYVLCCNHQVWTLQLSMVGRYAVLFRHGNGGLSVIDPMETDGSREENLILHLVKKYRVAPLGENILAKPVRLRLFYTIPQNVRVYHALFSEVEEFQWKGGMSPLSTERPAEMAACV